MRRLRQASRLSITDGPVCSVRRCDGAFQFRLQASGTNIPSSFLLMLPYLLTVLVISSWRGGFSDAPAALGENIDPKD